MKLIDYIYIDDALINFITAQINEINFKRQLPNWLKSHGWIANWIKEISIAGNKISISRSSSLSETSQYEKIYEIIQFMKDNNNILEGRPNWQGSESPDYWLENCWATRAYFKSDVYPELAFSIWISEENDCESPPQIQSNSNFLVSSGKHIELPAKLFLLNDLESNYLNYQKRISSPYSVLAALGTILHQKLPPDSYDRLYADNGLHKELATKPLETLKLIGAKIYPKRRISVLYKIRHLFPEFHTPNYQFLAIAYPVFIANNRKENNLKIDNFLEEHSSTQTRQLLPPTVRRDKLR